jgi:type IV pilus assembly protein PilC
MPLFTYVALDKQGERIPGKIEAPTKESAEAYLVEEGHHVLGVFPVKEAKNVEDILARVRPIKLDVLVYFSRQLATMIGAGISPPTSLNTLAEQETNPKFKEVVLAVSRNVEAGMPLAEAFSEFPELFTPLYISMIHAGEASGSLPDALDELASQLEKNLKLRRAIKSATTYPKVVLGFAFVLISVLMVTIVPKFAKIFVDTVNSVYDPSSGKPRPDDSLPKPTQIVLDISHVLFPDTTNHDTGWMLQVGGRIIGVFVLIALGSRLMKRVLREPGPRRRWDAIKLKFPLRIGPLVQKIAIARFSRTFASLIRSGVPATQAMEIVADTSGNVLIGEAVQKARERMLAGAPIYEPLQRSGVFPPMVTRMVQVGEETGQIENMLERVAVFFEEEVDMAIKGLTSIVEPLMIMLVGAAVGVVIICTYLPMFKIYDLIG